MKFFIRAFLVLFVANFGLAAQAQTSATTQDLSQTFKAWRKVVADRLEMARHVYFVNHGGKHRLRQILMEDLGFNSGVATQWSNGTGPIALQDGIVIATHFEVQSWWLLGLDVLESEFTPRASITAKGNYVMTFQARGFTNFKEIIQAALSTRLPVRPPGHIFEPATCGSQLEIKLRSE